MTLVALPGSPIRWPNPFPSGGLPALAAASTADAVGEIIAFIGHVRFAAGAGTSKTFSSSGGRLGFRTGTVVWVNGATNVRLGIQDVSATTGPVMQPDQTWTGETYADIVPGVDTLNSAAWNNIAMDTGSGRTLTHGDLIAVVFEMTARGGSDTFTLTGLAALQLQHRSLMVLKTASYAAVNTIPNIIIECDDGTLCTLMGAFPCSSVTTRTFNTGTASADEYGNRIVPPFACSVDSLWSAVDLDGNAEFKLYSGTAASPVDEADVQLDANQRASSAGLFLNAGLATKETLTAGAEYFVTCRPTSVTSLSLAEIGVNSNAHLAFWPGGVDCYKVTRLDDAGALTATTTAVFLMGFGICELDDGAGGGGGGGGISRARAGSGMGS